MNHPAWIKLLPHTGDIVVAQDGRIKGINSFPRKLCCMSLYSNEINDNSVKGNNSINAITCAWAIHVKRERGNEEISNTIQARIKSGPIYLKNSALAFNV